MLKSGEVLPADTVIMSIGDTPDIEFLPDTIALDRGHIVVNEDYQTTEPGVYAIGDAVRPGLLTHAIGHGRHAAETLDEIFTGKRPHAEPKEVIDYKRMTLEYFDPRLTEFKDVQECAQECSSCGSCRDCGLCETVCPQAAISRKGLEGKDFEMAVNPEKCIGCGFCANVCPCGIWNLVENSPLG